MQRLLLAATFAVATATPAAAITFNYTGSIVTWTAPQDGIYSIAATGAQGGQGRDPGFAAVYTAGRGIRVGADFMLTAGTVLQIAVGGQGGSFLSGTGGGGGGGFSGGQGGISAGGGGGSYVYAEVPSYAPPPCPPSTPPHQTNSTSSVWAMETVS
jgi:hypothetical protein